MNPRSSLLRTSSLSLVAIGLALVSCKSRGEEQGAAPPPAPTAVAGLCGGGGGAISDSASAPFFERKLGDWCVDPNGAVRSYGEAAAGSLDQACTELFDGECEVYKGYGLDRVVTLRYVAGNGSTAAVSVNLSRFATPTGAYGFFTRRVLGDSDPKEVSSKPLEVAGVAAQGTGIVYLWRGRYVAELSYTNDQESPEQLASSSQSAIPALARSLAERLPGDRALPKAAAALPGQGLLPLGTSVQLDRLFGVEGTGPGATGYYEAAGQRWRQVAVVTADEAAASDILKSCRKLPGMKTTDKPLETVSFDLRDGEGGPLLRWTVLRKGASVLAVGDEPRAGDSGKLTADRRVELLSAWSKSLSP